MASSDFERMQFEALLKEYELHKQELLIQIQLHSKQTDYIQLYAAFLAAVVALFAGGVPETLHRHSA